MSDRLDIPPASANNFSQRVRETLMTYLGKQGNSLDRGLTLRDLVENGFARVGAGWRGGSGALPLEPGTAIANASAPDLTPPPPPEGFAVSAAISHVFIEHAAPLYRQGHGHLRTRVYGVTLTAGAPLPTFSDAVEVGQFSGTVWAMPSNPSTTWRLWIKWESNDGVLSPTPAGGTNGLQAVTGQDVALLLEALTGEITESQLYSNLGERIGLIDGPSSLPGSVNARVLTEATTRATQTGDLYAKYTVKIDTNGYVSGFGLASTANNATPFSDFAVRADKFYIASPSGPGVAPSMPFIVRTTPTTINGVTVPVGVYMSDAFIQNGTITNAKIANLAVDNAKIANLSVSTAKISDAAITTAKIGAAQITNALIGDAAITTAKIGAAQITNVLIADAAITNAKIGAAQITNVLIADAAITSAKIGHAEIKTLNVGGEAISATRYIALAYNAVNFADSSFTLNIPNDGTYLIICHAKRSLSFSVTDLYTAQITQTVKLFNSGVEVIELSASGYFTTALSHYMSSGVTQLSAGSNTFRFTYSLSASGGCTVSGGLTDARIYLFGAVR